MPAQLQNLDDFAPIKWATPYLSSPDWKILERDRNVNVADATEDADRFCKDTIRSYNGIQHWVELYQKPAPGSKEVTRTISLCKYGTGLNGFPGICHGGAVMTLMDEGLAFAMVASELERKGNWLGDFPWRKAFDAKRPITEILKGFMVTAKLDLKFMKPVLCPGVIGIETEVLENKGNKMKLRGVMKDGNGTPLLQADGVWVRIGGNAKL